MTIKRFEVRLTTAPHQAIVAGTNVGAGQLDAMALRFDHAMGRFESGEWSEAFSDLCALADCGHAPAARIALMLVRRGTSLFGGTFSATPEERARWHRHGLS